MDCAGFETRLTRLLAESDAAEDAALGEALRVHAEGCDDCRASLPLLEIALLPPAQRDPAQAPAGYWESFDARLEERLRQPRWPGRAAWAAAAILVLAIAVGWVITGPDGPPGDGDELGRIVELIEQDGEEPLLGLVDSTDGWWAATEGLDRLDHEAREELIRWLDEEAGQGEGGSV